MVRERAAMHQKAGQQRAALHCLTHLPALIFSAVLQGGGGGGRARARKDGQGLAAGRGQ